MGRVFVGCVLISLVALAHPVMDAVSAYRTASSTDPGAYTLTNRPLTKRVVLVIIDSWPERLMDGPEWMPKLFARSRNGEHGVLWAPTETDTMQGVMALATGMPVSGLSAMGLISSARYQHWTIFDDVKARGDRVLFSGGPAWVELFGDRGTDNFRETGHGPDYRADDLEGLAYLEAALKSSAPPALSVLHISETDFAAHQFGTRAAAYAKVLRFFDDALDNLFSRIPSQGTTVIVTGDHGNDFLGSHGGNAPIYRRVPVLMWGSGILAGSSVEMQASDMPATIAVLLGIRAPAAVLGMPAVEAMDLSADERNRIQAQAYQQAVINNPRVQENKALLAKAETALQRATRSDTSQLARAGLALSNAGADAASTSLRALMSELEPDLLATRDWKVLDWALAVMAFFAALILGRITWAGTAAQPALSVEYGISGAVAFLSIETLLFVRTALAGSIKEQLRHPHGLRLMIAGIVLLFAALAFIAARDRIFRWMRSHSITCVVMLYLLFTVLRPFGTLGLAGTAMIAAFACASAWPLRTRLLVTAAFAAYFAMGDQVLWPLFGERIAPRYWLAGPAASVGLAAWALLQRKYSSDSLRVRYGQLSSLALLLILLPAGGFGLTGYSPANFVPVASGMLVLFCAWTRVIGRPPWWAWLGPAGVLLFWWLPNSPVLTVALVTCAAGICLALSRYRGRTDFRVGAFMLLTSVLLMLSTPAKAVTLIPLLSVLLAFVSSMPEFGGERGTQAQSQDILLSLAALFVVACRFAIFDLFGNSGSPLLFGLQSLDINSAYIGNANRSIIVAVLMALLKIWSAGMVLFAVLGLSNQWRRWLLAIAGMAGLFALLNIAQTSVIAALAIGPRSDQYSWAAFSIFVNSGILVFGMLAFLVFAVFGAERTERSRARSMAVPVPTGTDG